MTHFLTRYSLKDYLERLPADVVLQRFSREDVEKRKILSSRMMSKMISDATSLESVKERYLSLSLENRTIILLTYICGCGGINVSLSKEQKSDLLNSYLTYLMVDDDSNEYLYGFSDLDKIFEENFNDDYLQCFESQCEDTIHPFFRYRALNDLIAVLNLGAREELKLKKNGELTLSTNSELKKITHISVDTVLLNKKNISVPFVFKFLLHYAFEQGLIYNLDNIFHVSYKRASEWIMQDINDIYNSINRSALEYCGRWNIRILENLIKDSRFYDFLKNDISDLSDTFQLLHYCGLIGACKDHKAVSICSTGELWGVEQDNAAGAILVMPDFSVIIPQTISPAKLYEFCRIGKLLKLDKVYKGKIDKETLCDSLSSGLDGGDVISFLEKWRAPSNIIMTVKEWINEFHRISIDDGKFIFISDQETVSAVGKHPQLSEYIEEIKTVSVFRIKDGYENRVISTLSSFGFDIRNQNHKEPDTKEPIPLLPKVDRQSKDLKLVSDFVSLKTEEADTGFTSGGKYSSTLKELSHHDLMQVIDYALLMESDLVIDYKGSDGVRKGMYTGEPLKLTGPNGSLLELTESDSGKKVVLVIDLIFRIAVSD